MAKKFGPSKKRKSRDKLRREKKEEGRKQQTGIKARQLDKKHQREYGTYRRKPPVDVIAEEEPLVRRSFSEEDCAYYQWGLATCTLYKTICLALDGKKCERYWRVN